jgi:hypothetical protein
MSLVKTLQEATSKTSLKDIVRQAGLSIILDGNWGHSALKLSGEAHALAAAAMQQCSSTHTKATHAQSAAAFTPLLPDSM